MKYISAFFAFIVGHYRYREETATFRAKLIPYHTTFGLIVFVLAAATAVAGLTEKAIFSLRYKSNVEHLLKSKAAMNTN